MVLSSSYDSPSKNTTLVPLVNQKGRINRGVTCYPLSPSSFHLPSSPLSSTHSSTFLPLFSNNSFRFTNNYIPHSKIYPNFIPKNYLPNYSKNIAYSDTRRSHLDPSSFILSHEEFDVPTGRSNFSETLNQDPKLPANTLFNVKLPEKIICEPKILEKIVEVPCISYETKTLCVPQVCIRKKIVEVPQKIIADKIVQVPKIQYQENIIQVPVISYRDKIIEIPDVKLLEKIVEVPQKIYKNSTVRIPKVKIEEKIIHVPKTVYTKKICEVPKIEYRNIEVEKVIEVPEYQVEYVYKDVEVPRAVIREVPVDSIVEIKQEKIVEKFVEIPVTKCIEVPRYIEKPVMRERFVKVEKRIPRMIEIPQPVDTYEEVVVPRIVNTMVKRQYPVITDKIVYEPQEIEVPVERIVETPIPLRRSVKKEIEIFCPVQRAALIHTSDGLVSFDQYVKNNNLKFSENNVDNIDDLTRLFSKNLNQPIYTNQEDRWNSQDDSTNHSPNGHNFATCPAL